MIVVSDTSVLRYLIEIGHVTILPQLFSQVLIPRAVADELQHPMAPDAIRAWAAEPPQWVEVRNVHAGELLDILDAGEAEAIRLAEQLQCAILIDESEGRKIARDRGLVVTGLLGVLEAAADLGYLDLQESIDALRRTRFRVHPNVLETLLNGRKTSK